MSGYGKAFESMYEGSMVGMGTDVFAVWGYVIAKVRDGLVELNPRLLAGIFGCSKESVTKAIKALCEPDPESRNPDQEGRRLVHEHAFQYRVVSAAKYKEIRQEEARREYQAEWARKSRQKSTSVDSRQPSTMSTNAESESQSATDSESDPKTETKIAAAASCKPRATDAAAAAGFSDPEIQELARAIVAEPDFSSFASKALRLAEEARSGSNALKPVECQVKAVRDAALASVPGETAQQKLKRLIGYLRHAKPTAGAIDNPKNDVEKEIDRMTTAMRLGKSVA